MPKLNWNKMKATARKVQATHVAELEESTPPPPDEPPKFYDVLNCYLHKKTLYFIPINAPHVADGHPQRVTHLAVLRMAGTKLTTTRHEFTFWEASPHAKQAQDIMDTTPTFQQFTRPFIFHDKEAASLEIKRILTLHAQD